MYSRENVWHLAQAELREKHEGSKSPRGQPPAVVTQTTSSSIGERQSEISEFASEPTWSVGCSLCVWIPAGKEGSPDEGGVGETGVVILVSVSEADPDDNPSLSFTIGTDDGPEAGLSSNDIFSFTGGRDITGWLLFDISTLSFATSLSLFFLTFADEFFDMSFFCFPQCISMPGKEGIKNGNGALVLLEWYGLSSESEFLSDAEDDWETMRVNSESPAEAIAAENAAKEIGLGGADALLRWVSPSLDSVAGLVKEGGK